MDSWTLVRERDVEASSNRKPMIIRILKRAYLEKYKLFPISIPRLARLDFCSVSHPNFRYIGERPKNMPDMWRDARQVKVRVVQTSYLLRMLRNSIQVP